MALSKIGTEAVEHISSSANATYLTVDASEQITVSSDGGAVTTSLQQGLAKAWSNVSSSQVVNDSLNVSSITDTGTGDYDLNWTNSFNNTSYSHVGADGFYGNLNTEPYTLSTGEANVYIYNNSFALVDASFATSEHGDLA